MKVITAAVQKLFQIVDKLEKEFPGRKFTLDGHLVGSLGECFAREKYDLELLPTGTETHDAKKGSRKIQIKTTQKNSIGISSEPEFLIVLKLAGDGSFEEIYNGGGARVWNSIPQIRKENLPKNGRFSVSLARLRKLEKKVSPEEKI